MTQPAKSTSATKLKEVTHEWKIVDAKQRPIGRIATEVARYLIGKHKATFAPNLDCGDNVVVVNASEMVLTGAKEQTKTYDKYSGYPGGLTKTPFAKAKRENPAFVMRHAVSGMLPKNKLRDVRLTRLYVYKDLNHPHTDKFQESK